MSNKVLDNTFKHALVSLAASSSGNWTVPAGVWFIDVEGWGGGGGNGTAGGAGSGGNGGGGLIVIRY